MREYISRVRTSVHIYTHTLLIYADTLMSHEGLISIYKYICMCIYNVYKKVCIFAYTYWTITCIHIDILLVSLSHLHPGCEKAITCIHIDILLVSLSFRHPGCEKAITKVSMCSQISRGTTCMYVSVCVCIYEHIIHLFETHIRAV